MTRTNLLRSKLADGQVAIGASCGLYSTTAIEVLGEHDLDFEHSGASVWDTPTIQEYVRAADHADVELVVRLPSAVEGNHGPMIRKILDAGVSNVVLPRVKTAEEVKAAVEASRFEYESGPGERGVGAARGSQWGADIDVEWIDREDSTVLCGIMVETVEALENIEEIVSVPGLGFVFIGSMDLSVALGVPTETEAPRFTEAVETIREACREAKSRAGSWARPVRLRRNSSTRAICSSGLEATSAPSELASMWTTTTFDNSPSPTGTAIGSAPPVKISAANQPVWRPRRQSGSV